MSVTHIKWFIKNLYPRNIFEEEREKHYVQIDGKCKYTYLYKVGLFIQIFQCFCRFEIFQNKNLW